VPVDGPQVAKDAADPFLGSYYLRIAEDYQDQSQRELWALEREQITALANGANMPSPQPQPNHASYFQIAPAAATRGRRVSTHEKAGGGRLRPAPSPGDDEAAIVGSLYTQLPVPGSWPGCPVDPVPARGPTDRRGTRWLMKSEQ
jgi:hypothetical protein